MCKQTLSGSRSIHLLPYSIALSCFPSLSRAEFCHKIVTYDEDNNSNDDDNDNGTPRNR
jgi:hypothetical protein